MKRLELPSRSSKSSTNKNCKVYLRSELRKNALGKGRRSFCPCPQVSVALRTEYQLERNWERHHKFAPGRRRSRSLLSHRLVSSTDSFFFVISDCSSKIHKFMNLHIIFSSCYRVIPEELTLVATKLSRQEHHWLPHFIEEHFFCSKPRNESKFWFSFRAVFTHWVGNIGQY